MKDLRRFARDLVDVSSSSLFTDSLHCQSKDVLTPPPATESGSVALYLKDV